MDIFEDFPLLQEMQDIFDTDADVQDILDTEARLVEIRNQFRIPRRIFRDQLNPLEHYRTSEEFQKNFGFFKDGFLFILDIVKDKLTKPYNPGSPTISPLLRLTVFLHYLRSNSFYRVESDIAFIQLPTSTICEVVNQTARDIASFSSKYIAFPDEEEKEVISSYFLENFKFPGCCGIFGELKFELLHLTKTIHTFFGLPTPSYKVKSSTISKNCRWLYCSDYKSKMGNNSPRKRKMVLQERLVCLEYARSL